MKHKGFYKFLILCMILASYFAYLSYEYNLLIGGLSSLLTWSFFVLCTPIADAGFLLDFPIRILFGVKMLITEIFVWVLAIASSVLGVFFFPKAFQTTALTKVFYHILITPVPYWIIILLSATGTFLSIFFGDEIYDHFRLRKNNSWRSKKAITRVLVMLTIFAVVISVYYKLASSLGIENIL